MYDAVVVGAGLSGLTAAHRLAAAGADVVVLEAGARVGGRVCSPSGPAGRWEAGGEAVDLANTRLRALADEVGATLRRSEVGWGDHGPAPVEWRVAGRPGPPDAPGYRRLAAEIARRAAAPEADDRFTVAEWMARDGAGMFDLAVAETVVSVTSSTMPVKWMSLQALAVKTAARSGAGDGAELRFADGAGGFAETLADGLRGRVRLNAAVSSVRAGRGRLEIAVGAEQLRAARAVVAVPLHARARIAGLPPVPTGAYGVAAKSLIELEDELPGAPTAVLTDTALGYAYRRDERSLGSFVGSTPAAWLLRAGRRAGDAAVAEAVRRAFGVRVSRITRVAYPRSYLIFTPGELRGFGARLADPAGPVHFAGAESSELPSFMEGAVRAGERAAAEVLAAQ
ncbi:MAG TPA: FAD-dependent oxidoreductase [Gaiellales bacterium]|nr:FAD-dependent oxidoreductase [Gaiellales bacterium]